jgi:hypothetical protein
MRRLAEESYDMVVFVYSVGACFVANYLAESTLAVLSPKFRDRSASLCFDDERSHRVMGSEVRANARSELENDHNVLTSVRLGSCKQVYVV